MLNNTLLQEEELWEHKSRLQWNTEGERNTWFFHQTTIQRRRRNVISALKFGDAWCMNEETMRARVWSFYNKIFNGNACTCLKIAQTDKQMSLSIDDQISLCREVDMQELRDVLWSFHPTKAHGPDGFQAHFFQQLWDSYKEQLLHFVNSAMTSGKFQYCVGESLCLIPKVANPNCISKFRPIILCNVTYKLITKVITMRL